MTLASWLNSSNLTPTAFADLIGVSRQAMWRYCSNERVPRPEILKRIHKATSGKVTANDFMLAPTSKQEVA